MKAIIYRVTLLEPTLVADLDGDPNSATAFDYLPGSTLRGAFINRYLRSHGLTDLAADPTARRLFFSGDTRYLNGYQVDWRHRRSLPTPQSWYEPKENDKTELVYDFAFQELSEATGDTVQWKPIRAPFCVVEHEAVRLIKPERWIAVHTARTRRFGRAMPEERIEPGKGDLRGAIFRYDALAAGQVFEAAVLCDEADESTLTQFISGEITLGKSRSGGYGRAQLQLLRSRSCTGYEYDVPEPVGGDDSSDSDSSTQDAVWDVPDARLVVTLLSDALLRDTNGQFTVERDVVTAVLEHELACTLGRPRAAFLRGRVIGGFNRKWGLPLPQTLAVAMGSVFVYHISTINRQKIHALLERGIGERRAEGFGRLAINWQTQYELPCDTTAPESPGEARQLSSEASIATTLVTRMVVRLFRQKLDRKVIELAKSVGTGGGKSAVMESAPRNAQLSRLRGVIADALMQSPPALSRVTRYLDDVEQRATARKQYEHARLAQQNLLEWLRATLAKADEQAWRDFFQFRSDDLSGIGGITPALTDALRHEYILRYVDAVLARAAKHNRQEE